MQILILAICAALISFALSMEQDYLNVKKPLRRHLFFRKGNMRIDAHSGLPLSIHDVNFKVEGIDDPKEVADVFVRNNISFLRKNNNAKEIISHHTTLDLPAGGAVVRYRQYCEGIPVYKGVLVVTVNSKNTVSYLSNNLKNYVCSLSNKSIHPIVSKENAMEAALIEMGVRSKKSMMSESKLVIFADAKVTLLAWLLRLSSSATEDGSTKSFEFLYDAISGENIQIKNLIIWKDGEEDIRKGVVSARKALSYQNDGYGVKNELRNVRINSTSSVKKASSLLSYLLGRLFLTTKHGEGTFVSFVNGTGSVFHPNPLATAQAKYFDEGYSDNCDSNSPELEAELKTVTLRDLSLNSDGKCTLNGKYAAYSNFGCRPKGNTCYVRNCDDFMSNREQPLFEAVNAYYHIDTMMRYIHDDLKIKIGPSPSNAGSNGGIKYDPHGAGRSASNYDSFHERIEFGCSGVDDAEDSHHILYVLAQGLLDWLTDGSVDFFSNEGLSSGFGDYLAMSSSRSLALWNESDAEYHWVFPWDGHNEFWKGRSTNVDRLYPSDLSNNPGEDGEIWSTCNMKIWDALGRLKSDKVHFLALFYSGATNQGDVARAIVTAAKDLEYSEEDIDIIISILSLCGYSVSCGDDVKNGNDECDGMDIGNATCKNGKGCEHGIPSCTAECTLDYSNCTGSDYQSVLELTLSTGLNGYETSWNLFDDANLVHISGNNYESNQVYSQLMCLLPNECYRFEIYNINGNGLENGDYELVLDGIPVRGTDPSFTYIATHDVGACIGGINKDCSAVGENLAFFGITIATDGWGSETTWDLYEDTSNDLIDSGGNYASSSLHGISNCLPEDECYIFTIHDSNNDGICCAYGFGYYYLVWNSTIISNTDPTFSENSTHKFGSCDNYI